MISHVKRPRLLLIGTCGLCFLSACLQNACGGASGSGTGGGGVSGGGGGGGLQTLVITSASPPSGAVGVVYDFRLGPPCKLGTPNCVCTFGGTRPTCNLAEHGFQLTVTGGKQPYSWKWAGATGSALPPGLMLSATGLIDGAPMTAGSYRVVVTVSDSSTPPAQTSVNYTIMVAPPPPPQINSVNSPAAVINLSYSFTFTASGGQLPLTWSESGALPTGLSFSSEGVLSGKPLVTGAFPITVMVRDSAGQNATPQNFTIEVTLHGFVMTGTMNSARISHRATLLSDGRVLVTGGTNSTGTLASAEIFDPASGTFSSTGSMATARAQHTATLLNGGKVLVAGGADTSGNPLASAEIFDSVSGTFSPTLPMATPRIGHTATLLNDGRVLIAGGENTTGALASAEFFDPATGQFTSAGNMTASRNFHTATLLSSGKVLIAGGTDSNGTALGDLFDPGTATFTQTATGGTQALRLAAALLQDGRVLLGGGELTVMISGGSTRCCLSGPVSVATAALFDSGSSSFFATGDMTASRTSHTATLLSGGKVLIAGGAKISSIASGSTVVTTAQPLASAEFFDPVSGTFAITGNMTTARYKHTATLLGNGKVLLVGGIDANGNALATAELFQ